MYFLVCPSRKQLEDFEIYYILENSLGAIVTDAGISTSVPSVVKLLVLVPSSEPSVKCHFKVTNRIDNPGFKMVPDTRGFCMKELTITSIGTWVISVTLSYANRRGTRTLTINGTAGIKQIHVSVT